ncbi:type II secretion system protein [Desulfobacterales bacterium HSG16]|nr:type II secretion system protein [Desulfobacterales bacterium HSG16]
MKASYKFTKCSGFTLIEIIITLVIVSILSTMIVTYMGTSFQQSSRPIHNYQKTLELHQTMENILAHYKSLMEENAVWEKDTNYAEGDVVTPTAGNGHRYICITPAGGISDTGGSEPTWTVNWPDVENSIGDNAIQWMEALAWLKINKIGIEDPDNKQDNAYGIYFSIENRFIKFTDGTEDPAGIANGDPADILKVTIANDIGQILTNLYTVSD